MNTVLKIAVLPAILAIGALYWLFFVEDSHKYGRELSQEGRRAEAVGAKPLPKSEIKITIKRNSRTCLVVDLAQVDGDQVYVIVRNTCPGFMRYAELHWKSKSPDGTVIAHDYTNQFGSGLESGERCEVRARMVQDPRVSEVIFEISEPYYH